MQIYCHAVGLVPPPGKLQQGSGRRREESPRMGGVRPAPTPAPRRACATTAEATAGPPTPVRRLAVCGERGRPPTAALRRPASREAGQLVRSEPPPRRPLIAVLRRAGAGSPIEAAWKKKRRSFRRASLQRAASDHREDEVAVLHDAGKRGGRPPCRRETRWSSFAPGVLSSSFLSICIS